MHTCFFFLRACFTICSMLRPPRVHVSVIFKRTYSICIAHISLNGKDHYAHSCVRKLTYTNTILLHSAPMVVEVEFGEFSHYLCKLDLQGLSL